MKDKLKCKLIEPKKYLEIRFNCGQRAFYDVMNDVHNFLETMYNKEHPDGYFESGEFYMVTCDYEGDPIEMRVYNNDPSDQVYIKALLEYLNVKWDSIDDLDIVCSPF